jgi:flagellin
MNRLEKTYNGNKINEENTTAAESRMRDTDMASSFVLYSTLKILNNANMMNLANVHTMSQDVVRTVLKTL